MVGSGGILLEGVAYGSSGGGTRGYLGGDIQGGGRGGDRDIVLGGRVQQQPEYLRDGA